MRGTTRWTPETLRRKGFIVDDQLGSAAPTHPVTLILPYPPSTWKLYTIVHNRKVLTQEARYYRKVAVQAATYQYRGHAPFQGALKVTMELHQPSTHGLDVDNAQKAIFDALTHARVWNDDRQIDEFHFTRVRHAANPYISLTIEELSP